jgi:hypothetical protein
MSEPTDRVEALRISAMPNPQIYKTRFAEQLLMNYSTYSANWPVIGGSMTLPRLDGNVYPATVFK